MNGPVLGGLTKPHDFDLFVIGADVGGIACLKESARYSKRVAVANHTVTGTCTAGSRLKRTDVDVGFILKKLMHRTAALGKALSDSKRFGWMVPGERVEHDWSTLIDTMQDNIDRLNDEYEKDLMHENIKSYSKKTAMLIDDHTIKLVSESGKEKTVTASNIVLAMGGRPSFPNVAGAREHCTTLDELFSMKTTPGKTLVYGMTTQSLECAGFLRMLGYDVTVLASGSFMFQNFDKELVNKIIDSLKSSGVEFLLYHKLRRVERINDSSPSELRVTYKNSNGELITGEFNTVLITTEKKPCTEDFGLQNLNINLNPASDHVITNNTDQTNVENIYAIGYITQGRTRMSAVAIHAGQLLARRLFACSEETCEYTSMPVTIFTPLEAASCGYTEDAAVSVYGKANIDVFYTDFTPQYTSNTWCEDGGRTCVAKLIAHSNENHRIVGLHVVGSNACDVIEGFSFALHCGMTKDQFKKISKHSLFHLL